MLVKATQAITQATVSQHLPYLSLSLSSLKVGGTPCLWERTGEGKRGGPQGVTKRCRLSLLTNSPVVYESQCGGTGGRRGAHGAQINFNLWVKVDLHVNMTTAKSVFLFRYILFSFCITEMTRCVEDFLYSCLILSGKPGKQTTKVHR